MKYFILLILLLNGCCETETQNFLNPDSILSTEIEKKVFWKLKQEYGLYPVECGWSMRGLPKIRGIHCAFFYFEELSIEKAREMILRVEELFLTEINTHEHLRSHLTHHPFTPESIEATIVIKKTDFSSIDSGKLCVIAMHKNRLDYRTNDSETKRLKTIHTETNMEAKTKIFELKS